MAKFRLFSREKDGSGVVYINLDLVVAVEPGAVGGTLFMLSPLTDSKQRIHVAQPIEEVIKSIKEAGCA